MELFVLASGRLPRCRAHANVGHSGRWNLADTLRSVGSTRNRFLVIGVHDPNNKSVVRKWLEQAAYARPDPEAQWLLGWLNEEGIGVERDLVFAHIWYSIAERSNWVAASNDAERVAGALSETGLSESKDLQKDFVSHIGASDRMTTALEISLVNC